MARARRHVRGRKGDPCERCGQRMLLQHPYTEDRWQWCPRCGIHTRPDSQRLDPPWGLVSGDDVRVYHRPSRRDVTATFLRIREVGLMPLEYEYEGRQYRDYLNVVDVLWARKTAAGRLARAEA